MPWAHNLGASLQLVGDQRMDRGILHLHPVLLGKPGLDFANRTQSHLSLRGAAHAPPSLRAAHWRLCLATRTGQAGALAHLPRTRRTRHQSYPVHPGADGQLPRARVLARWRQHTGRGVAGGLSGYVPTSSSPATLRRFPVSLASAGTSAPSRLPLTSLCTSIPYPCGRRNLIWYNRGQRLSRPDRAARRMCMDALVVHAA